MHPILLKIGPITIYTFGVMLSLGFIVGSSIAARGIREEKGDVQKFWDLCFWIFVAGIVGSRLHYVIVNIGDFFDACFYPEKLGLTESSCAEVVMVWKGGLAFFGGFILATQLYMLAKDVLVFLVGYVWLRKRKQFHGQVTFVCIALYSFLRFWVEVLRGDYRRGFIFKTDVLSPQGPDFLSNAQLIAIVLFLTALLMLVIMSRRSKPVPSKVR